MRDALAALASLDQANERFEVVVVVDGDDASDLDVPDGLETRVLHQIHAGPAAARNRGAAEARGRILAFLDDDCRPEAAWLNALTRAIRQHPHALVSGRVVDASGSIYGEATQLLLDELVERLAENRPERRFATSNNMAVAREGFLIAGGFDERFPFAAGEDRELAERWLARGGTLVGAPDAVVRHVHQLTLTRFLALHARYGRGTYHLRRERTSARFERPALYARLLLAPLRRDGARTRTLALTTLLALSQAATFGGLVYEWVSRGAGTRARSE